MKKKIRELWLDFANGILMYLLTLLGVFMSRYYQDFRQGELETLDIPGIAEIVMSCFIALLVSFMVIEQGGDPEGKRKNMTRRALAHLSNGFMWEKLIGG